MIDSLPGMAGIWPGSQVVRCLGPGFHGLALDFWEKRAFFFITGIIIYDYYYRTSEL